MATQRWHEGFADPHLFPTSLGEASHALGRKLDLIERGGETATDISLAARTERAARDAGDFLLFKQFEGKLLGAEAG